MDKISFTETKNLLTGTIQLLKDILKKCQNGENFHIKRHLTKESIKTS